VKGETGVNKPEESLTEREKADGENLTCCRVAVTDVSLEAEELVAVVDYPAKTVPCRLNSLTKLTDDIVEVILRLQPGQPLKFQAGQYVDVIGRS
jgi:CDP-4-dehydro-6-deoxyglucose reductase